MSIITAFACWFPSCRRVLREANVFRFFSKRCCWIQKRAQVKKINCCHHLRQPEWIPEGNARQQKVTQRHADYSRHLITAPPVMMIYNTSDNAFISLFLHTHTRRMKNNVQVSLWSATVQHRSWQSASCLTLHTFLRRLANVENFSRSREMERGLTVTARPLLEQPCLRFHLFPWNHSSPPNQQTAIRTYKWFAKWTMTKR